VLALVASAWGMGPYLEVSCVHLKAKHPSAQCIIRGRTRGLPATVAIKWCRHDLYYELETSIGWDIEYLGHHASPCYNVSLARLPCLLLECDYPFQKAVEVLVYSVISLPESTKTFGQVGADAWWVIVT
jgi:hypothetical protein